MEHSNVSVDLTVTDQMASVACPICSSRHCQLQATARKAGVVVGGVLGAMIAVGLSGAMVGAVSGGAIASVVSRRPPDAIAGTIGGAIIGFAWGAIAGYAVGADIDQNTIRIHRCIRCDFEFEV